MQETGESYALAEYGVTPRELTTARRRVRRSVARAQKTGEVTEFKGDWRELKT